MAKRTPPLFCPLVQGSQTLMPHRLEKQKKTFQQNSPDCLPAVCGKDPAFLLLNAGARTGHSQSQPYTGEGVDQGNRQHGECGLYELANLGANASFIYS